MTAPPLWTCVIEKYVVKKRLARFALIVEKHHHRKALYR